MLRRRRLPTASRTGLAHRIAWHRTELVRLEQQQRQALVAAITTTIGPNISFSAAELFAHRAASPELAAALADAGIASVGHLGRLLRRCGLTRIGRDESGCIWTLSS